jgi:hypothetical protein
MCLEVSTIVGSMTKPNLEFKLEKLELDCSEALTLAKPSIDQVKQMYNSTK